MSLSNIANSLRREALANPGEEQSENLKHGASVHLRADVLTQSENGDEIEFHFKIERAGQLPLEASKEYAAWLREIQTFRDERYFNVPAAVETRMLPGKRKYAAVMVWTEVVERAAAPLRYAQKHQEAVIRVSRIPQNEMEMEEWARTLGQGVKVSGVDVFTGDVR